MADEFDPYYEWLGIPPKDQPPHHYRLLGIEILEQNLNVIERAADRQMGHVRSYQSGRHTKDSQRLLNELSAAKVCLLNPQRKADYDQQLQQQVATRQSATELALPADTPIPELPPGVPTEMVTSAPAPYVAPAAAFDIGISPKEKTKDKTPVADTRHRPAPLKSWPMIAGTAVFLIVGCLFGYYFLVKPGGNKSGGAPIPQPDPEVAQSDPDKNTTSPEGNNEPPPVAPATNPPPGTLPQPSLDSDPRLVAIDESTATIADPATLAPAPEVPNAVTELITTATGLVDARCAFCQTLLWSRFDEANRGLRTQGYRLSRCRPYLAAGEWRVAAVWLRDGLPSRIVGPTDAATLQKVDQVLTEQGFVPTDVSGMLDGQRECFVAVWAKPKSSVGAAVLTLGLSAADYKTPQAQMRQKGLRSVVHGSYVDAAGNRKHCDLWIQSPLKGGSVVWSGDQNEVAKQMIPNALHTDVGATLDPAKGLVYSGSRWTGGQVDVKLFAGMLIEPLQREAASQIALGYLPAALSVAPMPDGQLVSVSLWGPAAQLRTPLELVSRDPLPGSSASPASANEFALRFDGQGSIEIRDSRGLANISSDFTIEAWLRFNEQAYSTANILFGTGVYQGLHPEVTTMPMKGWLAGIKPERTGSAAKSQFILQWADSGGQTQTKTGELPPFDEQWHHVALCNRGSPTGWELVAFVDGVEALRIARPDSKDSPSPVGVYFGRPPYVVATRHSLHGSLRAFRLSSGVRYPDNFQSETRWTKDGQTVALLDFTGTNAAEIADLSGNGRQGAITGATWVDQGGNIVRTADSSTIPTAPVPGSDKLSIPANPEAQVAKVREVFKNEIAAAKDPLAWAGLARTMLSQAAQEQDPEVYYALLVEARRLAVDGIDWNLAARAIEEVSARFQVDAFGLRAEVLNSLTKKAKVIADRKLLAETAVAQAEAALAESALDAVDSMLASASNLAPRGERDLVKQITDLRKRLSEEKRAQQMVRDARTKLAESPQDPLANESLGKYLCFTKDDWDTGIKHLARGPDGKLTSLARSDDSRPTDASDRVTLADSWSEFAKSSTDAVSKLGGTNRALHWYQLALAELAGVKKLHAEKQIEDLSKSASAARGKAKFTWLEGEPGVALELRGHTADITSLAIARSGRFLVSGGLDDTVRMWELSTGKQSGQITPNIGDIQTLLLSPDDRNVAIPVALSGEYSIGIWNLQNGQLVGSVKADGVARQLAGSLDWRRVAYAKNQNGQGNLLVYNLTTLSPVAPLTCPGSAIQIAISRTGRLLAAADTNNVIFVWDLQTGKSLAPLSGHSDQVSSLAFSPNERQLASCGNRLVILWDLTKGVEEHRITPPPGGAYALAYTPDGNRLLTSGSTLELSVYNVQQGNLVAQVRNPSSDGTNSTSRIIVCFPDGRAAAIAGYDSLIRVWRLPP